MQFLAVENVKIIVDNGKVLGLWWFIRPLKNRSKTVLQIVDKEKILHKTKILNFADWLERRQADFKMNDWCRCIAGQACLFFDGKIPDGIDKYGGAVANPRAVELLKLTPGQAIDMFTPVGYGSMGFHPMTSGADVAANMLRRFAETGKVEWIGPKGESWQNLIDRFDE